jgi:hypothetical protein
VSAALLSIHWGLALAPTNTQDHNVLVEVSAAGLIPANDYGVVMEVSAGIPFDAEDFNVVLEVSAATTLIPAKPLTAIHWFTPG